MVMEVKVKVVAVVVVVVVRMVVVGVLVVVVVVVMMMAMMVVERNRINNIYIDGTQIDTVSHTQFMGVIIDNKINWNEHIKYTCKNI